jgi:hypothetical protein
VPAASEPQAAFSLPVMAGALPMLVRSSGRIVCEGKCE